MFGSRFWNLYGAQFFNPGEESGGGGEQKPGETKPDDPLAGLTDAQKAALQARIDSAASAARRDGEKAGLTKAQQDAAAKAAADEEERKRRKAIEDGDYQSAKASIEAERDAAKAERDAEKAEKAEYAAIAETALTDREKALKASGNEKLIAAYPKDGTPLERWKWLSDARTEEAIAVAAEAQKVATARDLYRTPGTPKPNGDPTKAGSDEARKYQQSVVASSF